MSSAERAALELIGDAEGVQHRPELRRRLGDLGVATAWVDIDGALDLFTGQIPVDEVPDRITALARDSEVLSNLQDRTSLAARLRQQDLGPLLEDLAGRHVPPDQVGVELELAWWKSALERLLAADLHA